MKGSKCNTCEETYFPHYVTNNKCKKCPMTIKQHFKEFLQKEGALEPFIENCIIESPAINEWDDIVIDNTPYEVSNAFYWRGTDQGHDYWDNIRIKWRNHLKTIEK